MSSASRTRKTAKVHAKGQVGRFPLYLHKSGNYAKKIRNRTVYFGKDRDQAFARWINERDSLQVGLIVRIEPKPAEITLAFACDALLAQKQSLVDSGELSPRSLEHYRVAVKRLIDHFHPHRLLTDLKPVDFVPFRKKCATNVSAVTCGNTLRYVRSILRFAYDQDLIEVPIKFGKALGLPSKAVIRAERQKRGPLMFSSTEILQTLEGKTITTEVSGPTHVGGAGKALRAMILLAINCGFGGGDCSNLTFNHINLESGWHTFARPKTSLPRRCALWPETILAIREYLKVRKPSQNGRLIDRVFVTRLGNEYVRVLQSVVDGQSRITPKDSVGMAFGTLLNRLQIKRARVAFYSLRRTFRTVADVVNDQPAIDLIMGHSSQSMAALYRQSISDERLKAVTDYVRNWLFGAP